MTLKYESEILFDLMKRDGDDTPSDVLPYESELKEKYLQQVEGAYPKLQDYRPEWLNYNLNAHLPADFPVESVSNVTNATFENVVPYAYGSAILKGQTLVNHDKRDRSSYETLTATGSSVNDFLTLPTTLKTSTKYLIIIDIKEVTINGTFRININSSGNTAFEDIYLPRDVIAVGIHKKIVTSKSSFDGVSHALRTYLYTDSTTGYITYRTMILEYQEGMENWDIPYFTGMQSVQMPVLSTTGKNLLDVESVFKVDGNNVKEAKDGSVVLYKPSYNSYIFETIKVKANTTYTISCEIEKIIDGGKPVYGLGGVTENKTAISDSNGNLVLFMRAGEQTKKSEVKFYNIQLEEGSTATSYETHKTNILTVNEDVTLRGIGDVQDTLNCLTGELTERIGEIVLDGSEDWGQDYNGFTRFRTQIQNGYPHTSRSEIVSNFFPFMSSTNSNSYPLAFIYGSYLYVYLEENTTVDSLKEWLKENKPTIQYKLETPTIKTVDLTVTDQDGNTTSVIRPIEGTMYLMTEGDTVKPLFSGEIPVEATTQNLASFIEEE